MLERVGMVAGVEGVAIVRADSNCPEPAYGHGARAPTSPATQTPGRRVGWDAAHAHYDHPAGRTNRHRRDRAVRAARRRLFRGRAPCCSAARCSPRLRQRRIDLGASTSACPTATPSTSAANCARKAGAGAVPDRARRRGRPRAHWNSAATITSKPFSRANWWRGCARGCRSADRRRLAPARALSTMPPATHPLRRRAAGTHALRIGLLEALLARPGAGARRAKLMDRVWGDALESANAP